MNEVSTPRVRPAGAGLVLIWHAIAAAILLIIPAHLVAGEGPWGIGIDRLHAVVGLPLAYLVSGVLLSVGWRQSGRCGPGRSLATLAIVLAALFLWLLLYPDVWYSRRVLLAGFVLATTFIVMPALLSRRLLMAAAALLLIVGAVSLLALRSATDEPPASRTDVLATSHGTLAAVHYTLQPTPESRGGGITLLDAESFLLATGDGDLFRLRWVGDSLHVTRLPLRVPLNRAEFAAAAGQEIPPSLFRVADVLARPANDSLQIVASHHHWHDDQSCFVMRLSSIVIAQEELEQAVAADRWRTLYDTKPCLRFKESGWPFAGPHIGGRLADFGAGRILASVGDFQFDGWNSDEVLPQDRSADYGKMIIVGPDGEAELLTMGHRNPQGLHIDAAGRIWSTEHGPQGGDLLHEIVPGANYGWPYVTYGTEYGDDVWPLQRGEWSDSSFRPAVFAWVPSIGISNLIEVRTGPLAAWVGDLLVASLDGRSLFRVRREGGRVVYVEPIQVGSRIRDLVEGPDGRIVLMADGGTIIRLEAETSGGGEALFARCLGCHSTEAGAGSAIGPSLHRIYSRRIAADAGFNYSPALRSVSGRWSASNLDAFLADPQAFAPGTIMELEPMTDPAERATLIEFLKTIR
jgi:glucose/arabinose dehydrogenase